MATYSPNPLRCMTVEFRICPIGFAGGTISRSVAGRMAIAL
jgi:hypothetical protein